MASDPADARVDGATVERPSAEEARSAVRTLIRYIGEDPDREGLLETPARVVRSYERLYGGYSQVPEQVLRTSFDSEGYDQVVMLRRVEFYSMCEHHMLPFSGSVTVGYLPSEDGRVVGISKLARLVEVYARRMQIQERMTREIADAFEQITGARGVGVLVRAQHLCMVARGVEKQQSEMVTSALRGVFRDQPSTRAEFLRLVGDHA